MGKVKKAAGKSKKDKTESKAELKAQKAAKTAKKGDKKAVKGAKKNKEEDDDFDFIRTLAEERERWAQEHQVTGKLLASEQKLQRHAPSRPSGQRTAESRLTDVFLSPQRALSAGLLLAAPTPR